MSPLEARDHAQQALPLRWRCRTVAGVGPIYWVIQAPDGQIRSLMGLNRLNPAEIKNRVQGLVTRMHYGGK